MSVEAYVKNLTRGNDESNYEIMKARMRDEFAKLDLDAMLTNTGHTVKDGVMQIRLIDRDYTLNTGSGLVTCSDGAEANFNETLTVYDLLSYAKPDAAPAFDYVTLQSLARIQNASSSAGHGMFRADELFFDAHFDGLAEALRRIGGTCFGKGDASFKVPVYRDIYAVFSFWRSDEEFPASLNLLFDRNILDYMHYETVWYTAMILLDRIKEELKGITQ